MHKKKSEMPSTSTNENGFDYEEFGEDDYGDDDIPDIDQEWDGDLIQ